ncbi:MAG: restriction endonuclease subunit S [Stellaceae bacterium]
MKSDWKQKQLGDLCDVVNGGTPKTNVRGYWGGRNLWITPAEMGKRPSPYVNNTERTLTDLGLRDSSARILPPNSVILSSRAPIGHLVINTESMATNQGCKGLVPGRELNHKFLYYYLTNIVDLLDSLGTGTTFRELSGSKLKEVVMPVPPLLEQQRIVVMFDEAFGGIASAKANAKKNLQNSRALLESHINSIFTQHAEDWGKKSLVELCDPTRVITYGVIKLGDEVSGGVPCLRTSNVRWLNIDTNGVKQIEPSLSSEYSRTILRGGEVLVNVRGTLGGVAVVPPSMRGWNVSREVAVVPVDPFRANPAFLCYLIGSSMSQHWLGSVKKGAAYVGINIEDLRLLPVSAPSIDKQEEIVCNLRAFQTEIERLESIYEQKLTALEGLKKSFLHQGFSGEL